MKIPDPGATRFRLFRYPPDEEMLKKAKEEGVDPVAFWRQMFNDELGMHTTDTIDIDIILEGEL